MSFALIFPEVANETVNKDIINTVGENARVPLTKIISVTRARSNLFLDISLRIVAKLQPASRRLAREQ